MFDSARFTPENLKLVQYQREYDSLAYSVIILIIASIVFWLACLFLDIFVVCSPDSAAKLFESCSRRGDMALRAARARVAARRRAAAGSGITVIGGGGGKAAGGGGGGGGGGAIGGEGGDMGMTSNPLFLSQMQAGAASGELGAHYADDALASPRPPDAAVWGLIRESLTIMREKLQTLQQENAILQNELLIEKAAPKAAPASALGLRVKRAEFEPIAGGGAVLGGGEGGGVAGGAAGTLVFRTSATASAGSRVGGKMLSMRSLGGKAGKGAAKDTAASASSAAGSGGGVIESGGGGDSGTSTFEVVNPVARGAGAGGAGGPAGAADAAQATAQEAQNVTQGARSAEASASLPAEKADAL
jgi:hypothetical protein